RRLADAMRESGATVRTPYDDGLTAAPRPFPPYSRQPPPPTPTNPHVPTGADPPCPSTATADTSAPAPAPSVAPAATVPPAKPAPRSAPDSTRHPQVRGLQPFSLHKHQHSPAVTFDPIPRVSIDNDAHARRKVESNLRFPSHDSD